MTARAEETPTEEAARVPLEQLAESAVTPDAPPLPSAGELPWIHYRGLVERTWKSVAEAKHYRAWLEHEQDVRAESELTPGERKVLRFLKRDPRTRTRTPPADPRELTRFGTARLKRQRKHDRAVELERRSLSGKRARAGALPRPDYAAVDPSPETPDAV